MLFFFQGLGGGGLMSPSSLFSRRKKEGNIMEKGRSAGSANVTDWTDFIQMSWNKNRKERESLDF